MNTQFQIKISTLFNLFSLVLSPDSAAGASIAADSRDYGFDFDEQELGEALSVPLALKVEDISTPVIAADEFDSLYKWFIA